MKRALAILLVPALALTALPVRTFAVINLGHKILLHVRAVTTENVCYGTNKPSCATINTHGNLAPGNFYYTYILVTDGDGVDGVCALQCGISYGATTSVFRWTRCDDVDYLSTGWPASGGGAMLTWDPWAHCQRTEPGGTGTGVVAVAGYFYMGAYANDVMSITPRPVDNLAAVADCHGLMSLVATGDPATQWRLGKAGFGTGQGYSPCGLAQATPVQQSTWGSVKSVMGQ